MTCMHSKIGLRYWIYLDNRFYLQFLNIYELKNTVYMSNLNNDFYLLFMQTFILNDHAKCLNKLRWKWN